MSKVLVIEDDKFLANAYQVGFEGEGFEVVMAYDGEEALRLAEETKPDVILLDILLPKVDGFQVLEQLKKNPKTLEIPIIIASNLGQQQDIDKGMSLGANDYIVKSESSVTEILEKINKFL